MNALAPLPHVVHLSFPEGRGVFHTVVKPWLDAHIGPMRFHGRPDGMWDAAIMLPPGTTVFSFRSAEDAMFFALRWRGEDLW